MTRIFPVLAALNGLMLAVGYLLGVLSKLRDGVHNPSDQIFWYHFLFGLSAAILTLLVHCLIFTYFLGTGRWVKEVKIAYDLPDDPLPKLTRDLKRRVFPPALYAMLTVAATGMAGAAAQVQVWPWEVHMTLGTLTLIMNLWAYWVEYDCLRINVGVLQQVLVEVDRLRHERGLPANADALAQEEK